MNYWERRYTLSDELKEALKDPQSEINKLLNELLED